MYELPLLRYTFLRKRLIHPSDLFLHRQDKLSIKTNWNVGTLLKQTDTYSRWIIFQDRPFLKTNKQRR